MRFTRNNKNAFYFNFKRNFLNFKEKLIIVNRLILVGNGFDLAHGLKTSYKDFIDDFWKSSLIPISQNYLCSLESNDDIFSIFCDYDNNVIPQNIRDYSSLIEEVNNSDTLNLNYNNSFFEILMKTFSNKNWVDIENEYYNELKKNKNIDKLNSDFEEIKKLLISYLIKIDKNISINNDVSENIYSKFNVNDFPLQLKEKFCDLILEKIKIMSQGRNINAYTKYEQTFFKEIIKNNNKERIAISEIFDKKKENIKDLFPFLTPNSILLLNFNYTNNISEYINEFNKINGHFEDYNISEIHIHGELNNPENPIIFGFGDDVDKKYQEFEDLNDNRYLENFKSIAYLQTDNYKKLLEFIDSEEYQVFIFGHSCGISDRTMLNTIFEHENCKSIKPFYHKREDGTDNYTELVQNISRNFNDKKKFRDRVVNKTYCEPLT